MSGIDTFPAITPSRGGGDSVKPRVIETQFGDGYKQSMPDGLNALERGYDAKFENRPLADIDIITTFLESHIGTIFYFTLPRESTPRKWRCTSWSRTDVSASLASLSAKFEEAFDL